MKKFSNCSIFKLLARALGFEPRSKVLETRMLPLHHARISLSPKDKEKNIFNLKNF